MYEKFYGLLSNPFALTPDPSYLYMGQQHRHALTLLEYALYRGTCFALISGEIGSGKTTIVNYLLSRVEQGLRIGVLTNTHANIGPLLPWILQSLRVQTAPVGRTTGDSGGASIRAHIDRPARSAADLYDEFARFLQREHKTGRRVVLIIDEAQNLSPDSLEELRVLSNLNDGSALLLQTILVGQPELRATLRAAGMRQFAQRISIDYHITPLQREETHAYIRHRIRVAGGDTDLIEADARELVHASTGGVPRLINQVCDTALVYGFSEQRKPVDVDLVEQVLRDRGEGGILPLLNCRRATDGAVAVE